MLSDFLSYCHLVYVEKKFFSNIDFFEVRRMLSIFTRKSKLIGAFLCVMALIATMCSVRAYGANVEMSQDAEEAVLIGGGYAVTGQSSSLGYTGVIYDEKMVF